MLGKHQWMGTGRSATGTPFCSQMRWGSHRVMCQTWKCLKHCRKCFDASNIIWEDNRITVTDKSVLVYSGKYQLSCIVLGCEHKGRQALNSPSWSPFVSCQKRVTAHGRSFCRAPFVPPWIKKGTLVLLLGSCLFTTLISTAFPKLCTLHCTILEEVDYSCNLNRLRVLSHATNSEKKNKEKLWRKKKKNPTRGRKRKQWPGATTG